jgi:hypothetical protein
MLKAVVPSRVDARVNEVELAQELGLLLNLLVGRYPLREVDTPVPTGETVAAVGIAVASGHISSSRFGDKQAERLLASEPESGHTKPA